MSSTSLGKLVTGGKEKGSYSNRQGMMDTISHTLAEEVRHAILDENNQIREALDRTLLPGTLGSALVEFRGKKYVVIMGDNFRKHPGSTMRFDSKRRWITCYKQYKVFRNYMYDKYSPQMPPYEFRMPCIYYMGTTPKGDVVIQEYIEDALPISDYILGSDNLAMLYVAHAFQDDWREASCALAESVDLTNAHPTVVHWYRKGYNVFSVKNAKNTILVRDDFAKEGNGEYDIQFAGPNVLCKEVNGRLIIYPVDALAGIEQIQS